jgi:GAF domain-containing protein
MQKNNSKTKRKKIPNERISSLFSELNEDFVDMSDDNPIPSSPEETSHQSVIQSFNSDGNLLIHPDDTQKVTYPLPPKRDNTGSNNSSNQESLTGVETSPAEKNLLKGFRITGVESAPKKQLINVESSSTSTGEQSSIANDFVITETPQPALAYSTQVQEINANLRLEAIADGDRKWSEEDQLLVKQVSEQLSLALENAYLFEETKKRSEDLALLNKITTMVSQSLNLDDILSNALKFILATIGFDCGLISLVDNETKVLTLASNYNLPLTIVNKLTNQGFSGTPCDLVYKSGRVITIPNVYKEDIHTYTWWDQNDVNSAFNSLKSSGYHAYLGVPLVLKGKKLGTICVFNQDETQIDDGQLSLMESVAGSVSISIENASLYTQTTKMLTESEKLYKASAELNAAQSYTDILFTLREYTILGKVDRLVSFMLFDSPWIGEEIPSWALEIIRWTSLPPSRVQEQYRIAGSPLSDLLNDSRIVLINNIQAENLFDENLTNLFVSKYQGKSLIYIPLRVGGLWIGYIQAVFGFPIDLTEDERRRLRALASQASIAIQNMKNIDLAEKRADEALKRSKELKLINDITQKVSTSLDLLTSLEIACQEIGTQFSTNVSIALMDSDNQPLKLVSSFSPYNNQINNGFKSGITIPLEKNFAFQQVIKTKKTITIDDPQHNPLIEPIHQLVRQNSIDSLVIIPIITASQVSGVVLISIIEPNRKFNENDIRLAETIILQIATAIQNANLFEQTQSALEETETLYEASAQLNLVNDYTQVLEIAQNFAFKKWDISSITIYLFDKPYEEKNPPSVFIPVASNNPLIVELDENSRFPIENLPAESDNLASTDICIINSSSLKRNSNLYVDILRRINPVDILYAPLIVAGQWIGFTEVLSNSALTISPNEKRKLLSLTRQTAVAVQNIRLLEETKKRAEQLYTAAEVARDTTTTLDLGQRLKRVVELLCSRFEFDHASVFLLDESGKNAFVRESTGKAGEEMKQKKHSLPVGGQSVIGQATATGQPVVLNDVTSEESTIIHHPNPLLPNTRAELGIPLKIGDRIIGALDVQSNKANVFNEDNIAVLQILADQIAVGVDNAHAYEMSLKAVEEIRKADELKTQFLANMSHELRTPLNSILGFSRVILKGIDGPITELQEQDLSAIYNSGQHLLGLINDILDLSKIEAGKMELSLQDNVDLNEIIQGVLTTAVGLIKDKPIQLHSVIPADLPLITADTRKVRQIILNLVSNAAKFTEEGSITVEAKLQRNTNGVNEILISVTDTGSGISTEDQKKLFTPFSQVDSSLTRKTDGTGLGLSISQYFVHMHGGEIGLQSELGKGSTFYFSLPTKPKSTTTSSIPKQRNLDQEETKTKTTTKQDSTSKEISSIPIFIVNNDSKIMKMYNRYLSDHNYKLTEFPTIIDLFKTTETKQPKIIILDITPEQEQSNKDVIVNQISSTIQSLRKNDNTRNIPLILCSSMDIQENLLEDKVEEFILKPFLADDLVSAITNLIIADDH